MFPSLRLETTDIPRNISYKNLQREWLKFVQVYPSLPFVNRVKELLLIGFIFWSKPWVKHCVLHPNSIFEIDRRPFLVKYFCSKIPKVACQFDVKSLNILFNQCGFLFSHNWNSSRKFLFKCPRNTTVFLQKKNNVKNLIMGIMFMVI